MNWKTVLRHDPCAYCGIAECDGDDTHLDHIVPRARGGTDRENLTASCAACNFSKNDLSLLAFLLVKVERDEQDEDLMVLRHLDPAAHRAITGQLRARRLTVRAVGR
jgi:5-methylcytosine-specific restriction endonuclease McrA